MTRSVHIRSCPSWPSICYQLCRHVPQHTYYHTVIFQQRRSITQAWHRKTAEAAEAWKAQAKEITAGNKESMLTLLETRGYINSVIGERDDLDHLMTEKRVGVYVGIDPTAPSLHIGHLIPLMALYWMYVHGFHTVSLLGGATAQIGDPSGRTESRETPLSAIRKANMVKIHYQLKMLWANVEHHTRFKYGYKWEWAWHRELANNNAWMNKLPLLEFLKVLGSGTRIGAMLGRDTVQNRMQNGEGMSYSEFTYPLMQAWDWWYMYQTKGIQIQIGGSDQFGNVLAGINAVNYIRKNHHDPDIRQEKEDPLMKPMGFTVPLLTTASGQKLGKSEGNAVWLDKDMTTVFDLHQFFVRTADADVSRYLRLFTFIPLPEIDRIMSEHEEDASKRIAQRRLAREVIEMMHGKAEADAVESQGQLLFRSNQALKQTATSDTQNTDINVSLNRNATPVTTKNMPSPNLTLPRSLIYNQPMARVLYSAGMVASRSEGHRLASNRGAYIGSRPSQKGGMGDELKFTPVMLWTPEQTQKYVIDDSLLILRIGKWKVKVIKIISDEEFDSQGLDAPGWAEWKEGQITYVDEEEGKEQLRAKAALDKAARHNQLIAERERKLWQGKDPEVAKRMQSFMQERYSADTHANAPDYTDWLRREQELKESKQESKDTVDRDRMEG